MTKPAAAGPPGYELLNTIGQGSTGTVYLARQPALDRYVAIKRLAPLLGSDTAAAELFRHEAQVMASIEHPNIVRLFTFVEAPDATFLVCEYVEGASLRAVQAESKRLAPEQSLGVLKGALTGLAFAHGHGLVHGDVKPENILADLHGVSKLADFGEAGAAGAVAADDHRTGTPAYMSPEAVMGRPLDVRSDVYSAAAMLFELLTGLPPYHADNPIAVMRMHLSHAVPNPCDLDPKLPARLGLLVQRGMAKDPSDRFASVADFITELTAAAAEGYGRDWEARASIKAE
ncbi:MAG: serine/threonine-protein kinase, partial [Candidatus Dormiibacterota bacterium]